MVRQSRVWIPWAFLTTVLQTETETTGKGFRVTLEEQSAKGSVRQPWESRCESGCRQADNVRLHRSADPEETGHEKIKWLKLHSKVKIFLSETALQTLPHLVLTTETKQPADNRGQAEVNSQYRRMWLCPTLFLPRITRMAFYCPN